MHARLTHFSSNPNHQDDALRWVDERPIPALRQQPGFKGFVMLDEVVRQT